MASNELKRKRLKKVSKVGCQGKTSGIKESTGDCCRERNAKGHRVLFLKKKDVKGLTAVEGWRDELNGPSEPEGTTRLYTGCS